MDGFHGYKWLASDYILVWEIIGFSNGLDTRDKGARLVRGATNISNMLGSIKWKNCAGIDQEWEQPLEGR